ncbi:hypothetical protein acdb102_38400 [Acidothermaceae bacterium B102]|nr:hypothetical protein acdb102_38400 [Acidothermaceae bacterium B102]
MFENLSDRPSASAAGDLGSGSRYSPRRAAARTGRINSMPLSESTVPTSPGPIRPTDLDPAIVARLKRDDNGLFAAVTQQWDTGEVLMVGWMDDQALHLTLTTGRCTYWSRSRQEYWVKGATSGHEQWVKSVALDCDADAVLVKVDQIGGACHTGDRTCFDADELEVVVGVAPVDGE